MNKNTLKIIILFFVVGVGFLSFALFVDQSSDLAFSNDKTSLLAQAEKGYVAITPGIQDELGSVDSGEGLSGILNLIFVWGIRIVIALSIVFVVFGAVQYMTTDAIYDKTEGKQRIQAAIGGLILALVSWLILNTINPDILKGGFLGNLDKLQPAQGGGGTSGTESGGTEESPTETGDPSGGEEPGP